MFGKLLILLLTLVAVTQAHLQTDGADDLGGATRGHGSQEKPKNPPLRRSTLETVPPTNFIDIQRKWHNWYACTDSYGFNPFEYRQYFAPKNYFFLSYGIQCNATVKTGTIGTGNTTLVFPVDTKRFIDYSDDWKQGRGSCGSSTPEEAEQARLALVPSAVTTLTSVERKAGLYAKVDGIDIGYFYVQDNGKFYLEECPGKELCGPDYCDVPLFDTCKGMDAFPLLGWYSTYNRVWKNGETHTFEFGNTKATEGCYNTRYVITAVGKDSVAPVAAPATAPVLAPIKAPVNPLAPVLPVAPIKAPVVAPVVAPFNHLVPVPTKDPISVPAPVPVSVPTSMPVTVAVLPTKDPISAPPPVPVSVPTSMPVTVPVLLTPPVLAPSKAPITPPVPAPVPSPVPVTPPVPVPIKAPITPLIPVPEPMPVSVPAPVVATDPAPTLVPVPVLQQVPAPGSVPVPVIVPVIVSNPALTDPVAASPMSAPMAAPVPIFAPAPATIVAPTSVPVPAPVAVPMSALPPPPVQAPSAVKFPTISPTKAPMRSPCGLLKLNLLCLNGCGLIGRILKLCKE